MDTVIAQQAFNAVCAHLRLQGRPSPSRYSPGTVGALRGGPDGNLKDAVGCLVPDAEYYEDLEMGTAEQWLSVDPKWAIPCLRPLSAEFLDRLLSVHDDSLAPKCNPGYVLEKGLHKIGAEFQLDVQEVYGFQGWGKKGVA